MSNQGNAEQLLRDQLESTPNRVPPRRGIRGIALAILGRLSPALGLTNSGIDGTPIANLSKMIELPVTPNSFSYGTGNVPETLFLLGGNITSIILGGVPILASSNPIGIRANTVITVSYTTPPKAYIYRQ